MKKYKLYRSCKKNVLLKNIVNFRRLNNLFSLKMTISMLYGYGGMMIVRFADIQLNNKSNNKFIDAIQFITAASICIEICFFALDSSKFLKSEEKIKNLDRLLNEKDIDFDFYNALLIEYNEDYIFMKDKDGKRIIGYGNDDIIYRDMDKRIDITDDVKKSLLPNKKKRKNK